MRIDIKKLRKILQQLREDYLYNMDKNKSQKLWQNYDYMKDLIIEVKNGN